MEKRRKVKVYLIKWPYTSLVLCQGVLVSVFHILSHRLSHTRQVEVSALLIDT